MHAKRISLPPNILNKLRTIPFLLVSDGTLRAPDQVVNPDSPIRPLFPDAKYHPVTSDAERSLLVRQLSAMGLVMTTLTMEMVLERIEYITTQSHRSRDIALELVELLVVSNLDYSALASANNVAWLPTKDPSGSHTISQPSRCRDSNSWMLFDECLPILSTTSHLPPALRDVFGWQNCIPLRTLLDQLKTVLEKKTNGYVRKVDAIVTELCQRNLTTNEITLIKQLVEGKAWIPTLTGTLATTSHMILGSCQLPNFHQTPSYPQELRPFLFKMGCTDK
jgi:hypothetical protein